MAKQGGEQSMVIAIIATPGPRVDDIEGHIEQPQSPSGEIQLDHSHGIKVMEESLPQDRPIDQQQQEKTDHHEGQEKEKEGEVKEEEESFPPPIPPDQPRVSLYHTTNITGALLLIKMPSTIPYLLVTFVICAFFILIYRMPSVECCQ